MKRSYAPARVLLLVCLLLAVSSPPALSVSADEAVRWLNVHRAANGIGPVAHDPLLSIGCARHQDWMAIHGMKHLSEQAEGQPGYSPEGAGLNGHGGGSEVLSPSTSWSESASPWEDAPIHEYLIVSPNKTAAGYDDRVYACMRATSTRSVLAPGQFAVYTGATGPQRVAFQETASESPYVPQQLVGIPQGATTGPNLLVFTGYRAPGVVSATITGPEGSVPTVTVDSTTENEVGHGRWFTGGGVVIPRNPLRPNSDYTAQVVWRTGPAAYGGDIPTATQAFTFRTVGRPNDVSVSLWMDRSGVLVYRASSAASPATVTLKHPTGATAPGTFPNGKVPAAAAGIWELCVRSGGTPTEYEAAVACKSLAMPARPRLQLTADRRLRVGPEMIGRRATITMSHVRRSCGRCEWKATTRLSQRRITLRSSQGLRVPRGAARRLLVRVATASFTRGSMRYRPLEIRHIYVRRGTSWSR